MFDLWMAALAVCVLGFLFPTCVCCGGTPSTSGCILCTSACFGTTQATATAPPTFSVTIAGATAGTCTSCAGINATYVLNYMEGTASACRWHLSSGSIACGYTKVTVNSVISFVGAQAFHQWQVVIDQTGGPFESISFRSPQTAVVLPAGLPDCEAISGLVIPFHSKLGFGNACNFTAATATITAGVCPP